MFEVTGKAIEMIKQFLETNQAPQQIRILMQSGCCGSSLGMALDEPQEKDMTFTEQGITFAIEKDLFEKAKPISLDFVEAARGSGFKITSGLASGGDCGSCG